jgi:chitin disaccharide deacetylase
MQRKRSLDSMIAWRWKTILVLALLGRAWTGPAGFAAEPTYAERLGWPPGSKVLIFHVDDVGMSHDSNRGAIEAVEKGLATSISIMFPCPWTTEIVRYVKEHPKVDAGVHLTLTSEWRNYRWGPLSGRRQVPGLVDWDGYLWNDVLKVTLSAKADEVETEIRAQLEQCRRMGLKPTHLDMHMGTVFARPDFLQRYVDIGIETGIPVMLPAGRMENLVANVPSMAAALRQLGKHLGSKLWDAGLPVLDDLHTGTLPGKPEGKKTQIIKFLRTMKPGVTQFIVHCTRPSETFRSISGSGPMRLAELEAMTDPEVKSVVEEEKIILTTWRELKERRDNVRQKGQAGTTR